MAKTYTPTSTASEPSKGSYLVADAVEPQCEGCPMSWVDSTSCDYCGDAEYTRSTRSAEREAAADKKAWLAGEAFVIAE